MLGFLFGPKWALMPKTAYDDRANGTGEIPARNCLHCVAASMVEGEAYVLIDVHETIKRGEPMTFAGLRTGDHVIFLGEMEDGIAADIRIEIDEVHLKRSQLAHESAASEAVAAVEALLFGESK